MYTPKFSFGNAIDAGWQIARNNVWFFVGIVLITWLMGFIPQVVMAGGDDNPSLILVSIIASLVLNAIIQAGIININLKFIDGGKGQYSHLFDKIAVFPQMILTFILYGVIVFAGLILLIIPGIIWGVKFQFFPYLIVDKGLGPIEALKRSAELTQDTKLDVFFFNLLTGVFSFIGILFFFVGVFWTMPAAMLATAHAYRQLEKGAIPKTKIA